MKEIRFVIQITKKIFSLFRTNLIKSLSLKLRRFSLKVTISSENLLKETKTNFKRLSFFPQKDHGGRIYGGY